jgi:hypothetical protein
MTKFFDKLFTRYPVKMRRTLEVFPGIVAWALILFPVWGSFFFPTFLAYFILFFDVWWFYKSFSLVINAYIATKKIQKAQATDWWAKTKDLPGTPDIAHILIIPNYTESAAKLRVTLEALTQQTIPLKQLYVVLAMEERDPTGSEKARVLIREFKHFFGDIFATFHPDIPGEVKGKSSNESYGGKIAYEKLVLTGNLNIDTTTISSVDADSIFDKHYFACLTYKFLTDPMRHNKFWQSAIVFYNNVWKVPAPTRIISFFGSLWRISLSVQGDKLLTHATYSLSLKLLVEIGFWDVDVIPEDYRIFFKAFFRKKGRVWVEPIFLKTSMDAALSSGYFNSLKNKYNQERRWSWGVSDDPLFIKWWLTVPKVPFWRKTVLLYQVLLDHILWPVNWFIITVAANIVPIINPVYSRTALGYSLPRTAGFILTLTIFAIFGMMYLDAKNRSDKLHLPWYRKVLFILEFFLMPIIGFFLSSLPALISHTQLMLGKRLEYKVTDKV